MFKPLHNLVTVIPDPKTGKTSGGLVLPDNFGDIFITGVVRAVGPGPRMQNGDFDTPPVYPGDRVMIAQHTQRHPQFGERVVAYPTIQDDGVTCIILNDSEIMGIVDRPKKPPNGVFEYKA